MNDPFKYRFRPVDQTRTGEDGNCFQAALATVLGLDLDDVPDFVNLYGLKWWEELRKWLAGGGLAPLYLPAKNTNHLLEVRVPAIVSGTTDRGLPHAVVWYQGHIAHDPHPSRAGLKEVVGCIVLLDDNPGFRLRLWKSTGRPLGALHESS